MTQIFLHGVIITPILIIILTLSMLVSIADTAATNVGSMFYLHTFLVISLP